ncbi:helix-turn-helix transcriptional regulator [Chondromyces apiculatus]|uniref:helix-turn-helix transcriptional regulator n=1 Tax=Chondromyces apiculatus TaxID=51 RepID=UPI001E4B2FCF|nr:WYL domain-containing transcriptional regulator [Chondromyces apiculatus]
MASPPPKKARAGGSANPFFSASTPPPRPRSSPSPASRDGARTAGAGAAPPSQRSNASSASSAAPAARSRARDREEEEEDLDAEQESLDDGAIGKRAARGRPRGPFTQHRRLDALRSLLQKHPAGLTIYDLARELDVTPRSLRRYLAEVRRELDLISAPTRPGGPRLWRLSPSEAPRRVEMRRTQAYALLAARRLFEPMRGSTLFEEIDLATQRLLGVARRPGRGPNAGVADARLEERFLYLPFAPKDYASKTEELDDLFQAVADLRPLRCRYRRARDGREERITIHPYALVLYKDAIYCVGQHAQKGEIRTFLLDRMRDTECAATERFELPEDFSIDDHFQGQFGIWRGREPLRIVIDFDERVTEFVRTRNVHPSQQLTNLPGGGVRLTMEIGDTTELTTWVLGFGETARVVEPPELVERVQKELRGALARYENAAESS